MIIGISAIYFIACAAALHWTLNKTNQPSATNLTQIIVMFCFFFLFICMWPNGMKWVSGGQGWQSMTKERRETHMTLCQHYATPYFIYYTILHYTTLHYTTLHYTGCHQGGSSYIGITRTPQTCRLHPNLQGHGWWEANWTSVASSLLESKTFG